MALVGPPTLITEHPVTLADLDVATRDLDLRLVGLVEFAAQQWREARGPLPEDEAGEKDRYRLTVPLVRALTAAKEVLERIGKDFVKAADQCAVEAGVEAEAVGRKDRAEQPQTLLVVHDGDHKLKVRPHVRDHVEIDEVALGVLVSSLVLQDTGEPSSPACDADETTGCDLNAEGFCKRCGRATALMLYEGGKLDGAGQAFAVLSRLTTWKSLRSTALEAIAETNSEPSIRTLAAAVHRRVKIPTGGWKIERDTGQRPGGRPPAGQRPPRE